MSRIRNWLNNELYPQISPKVEQMRVVWSELGEPCDDQEAEILEAMQEAEQILQRIMDRKLRHLHARREQLLDQSEKHAKLIDELGRLLDIEDAEPEEGMKLIQLENCLRVRVQELENIRQDRAMRLTKLRTREHSAATLLGEKPIDIPEDLLTESVVEIVRKRCDFLDEEKIRRQRKLRSMRERILHLMIELERQPEASFERDLMCNSEDTFQITLINMNGIENLASRLNEDLKRNETEASKCRESLRLLWDVLQVEPEYRQSFLDLYAGYRPSIIEALKSEISRCRQLKQENASKFIERVRLEISQMWDRCYYSSQQRRSFKPFYVEDLTEAILEVHDDELQRLQDVFTKGKPVYDVFRKRAELWETMLKFEKPTDDPQRFNNRGCRLLREEKERKKVMILFPKLEAELEKAIGEWEAEHKHRFLVYGMQVMDYVRDQWDAHRQEKENEKFERLRAKAKRIEDELVNGSKVNISRKRVVTTPGKENRSKIVKQVRPACASALFNPPTSATRTAISARPPRCAVKTSAHKTRVLPRRLVTQQSRIASDRTRASPSDTLLAQANVSQVASNLLGASHLSTYSEFTNMLPNTGGERGDLMVQPRISSPNN